MPLAESKPSGMISASRMLFGGHENCLTKAFISSILPMMEADRAVTDVGESVIPELGTDKEEKPKHPKKRFIGRKAAAEKAEQKNGANQILEDSGGIQGLQHKNFAQFT